jgi:CheY-like chemotaxis protein
MARRTALLAEDDPAWLGILIKPLEEKGLTVVPARTYEQAVESLSAGPIDLIVLDLKLVEASNELQGLELAREAYQKGIPCVVVTAWGRPSVVRQLDRYDTYRVMHKLAFDLRAYEQIIDRLIGPGVMSLNKPTEHDVNTMNALLRQVARGVSI